VEVERLVSSVCDGPLFLLSVALCMLIFMIVLELVFKIKNNRYGRPHICNKNTR
jgi:hypothetical protein